MSAPGVATAERSQAGRLLEIETALGPDTLLLVGLDGEEQVSRPFSYVATMLSTNQNIRPDALIGSNATAWVLRGDGERAPVNGFVRRFTAGPVDAHGLREYRAELVPWLWFLTCTSDCRIFQDVSVLDLLKQVFEDFGLTDYTVKGLTSTYPKLDYCVQYRESAFDFVSRWMEEAGLFYFFRHEAGKHTLVIADQNFQFQPAAEGVAIFAGKDDAESSRALTRWQHAYEFRPGRYAQKDFDFQTPAAGLLTREASVLGIPRADAFERYDYPGRYAKLDHGQNLTRMRIKEEEAQYHTVEGDSGYASFRAGHRFTLARHDIPSEESKAYVLFRVTHKARDTSHLAAAAEPSSYQNSFVAMPAAVRFRAARQTPCPVVQGPQTAMVVGPPGETIHTDKHGRVKLQFHWDREGKHDDRSSCWVRVSQAWAGAGWGGVNIPHVGHEVVVSFLDGDPDRPLVTGRVYNGENVKAVGLPANKTQSAMRDHSGNEILMEGKAGSQDIRVHAVKDMHVTVDNNRETHVKAHLTETVDKGQEVTVAQGYKETITEGATSTISGGLKSTVNGPWESTVNGKFTETVTGGEERTVSSGKKLLVTGGSTEDVTGERNTTVTGPISQSSTAATDLHADGAGTYTSNHSLTFAVAGSVIEITPQAITISTGSSTVKLNMAGVSVNGPKILLNG